MHRTITAAIAATFVAAASPAQAITYVNSIGVDGVTLNLRIETNGRLGLSRPVVFEKDERDGVGTGDDVAAPCSGGIAGAPR